MVVKKQFYINVITPNRESRYLRQLPAKCVQEGFHFFENSDEDRVWDYIVIHDDLSAPRNFRVRQGGLILISGEPEFIRYYGAGFLRQFDCVITTHSRLKKTKNHRLQNIALNWHFGFKHSTRSYVFSFEDLKSMCEPEKTKNISVITSSLALLPGHIKRRELIEKLKVRYDGKIDFFGKGTCFVDDKSEALLPYKFHLCFENSTDPHYWSEKFADPLLGFCVPVYCGDPCVGEYFDRKAFIPISVDDEVGVYRVIDSILENPDGIYKKMRIDVIKARNALIEKYNFFSVVKDLISEIEAKRINTTSECRKVRPNMSFMESRIGVGIIRLRRFWFKLKRKIVR